VGETFLSSEYLPRRSLSVSSNGSTWVKRNTYTFKLGHCRTFSILERIDVGETSTKPSESAVAATFSILERIDVGETLPQVHNVVTITFILSVSSNGSTWVKHNLLGRSFFNDSFVLSVSSNGSTWVKPSRPSASQISRHLSVSSNGSTWVKHGRPATVAGYQCRLSVSSNGSTWVKQRSPRSAR